MYYIGIDLGTSAVKLLLMEESGKICNIVSREYPLFFPHPGWSEQKPEDWFIPPGAISLSIPSPSDPYVLRDAWLYALRLCILQVLPLNFSVVSVQSVSLKPLHS